MSHQAPHASSFETSRFCLRLQELAQANGSTTPLQNLCTATQRLVSHAEAISDQIGRHLPQFTLHNGTHLWNVLGFMEELAGGQQAIAKLGAGDCAMAVWAAFIHDLGMVLEASELAALDAADHYDTSPDVQGKPTTWSDQRVQDWRAYRDGYEHWSAIRQEPHSEKSRMKLGIIRAAFIRDSHARHDMHTGHCRIADWLALIAQSDRLIAQALEDFALDERIVRVAVSHNQDIAWLPRQLSALGCDAPHAEHDAELGTIHWTWIGWLLRLADVFDCDASRTPRILFEHAGITDQRSRTEWQKHLSIRNPPTWQAGNDHQSLIYTCHLSPSPIVEKAIHQIIGWMNDEISKCRAAWNALSDTQRQGIELALPSEARPDIKKRVDDYLYQDIEFRLDRDAVVELLMGESLYGGPELALRELVQNALDAVHLRDQRNKLAIALEKAGSKEKARQHHEPWGASSGEVHVTWGTETDGQRRSWIKVQDNGVGMTVATMRRFLTQIGKSYYKSDDFHAEQELMRRHGILCTAISQFGIGFLSVFMLADHVEIHTRPVGATDHPDKTKPNWQDTERFPFRADIHGPHGLLAFYPHEVRQTGTTVTLWLREKFVLSKWDREQTINVLWSWFYETGGDEPETQSSDNESLSADEHHESTRLQDQRSLLAPVYEVARRVVWPAYPINFGDANDGVCLDEWLHFDELIPISSESLAQKAAEWCIELPEVELIDWSMFDWIDDGPNGTGSRVRVAYPSPEGRVFNVRTANCGKMSECSPGGFPLSLLSAVVEEQLPLPPARFQCLVNGIRVPGLMLQETETAIERIIDSFPLLAGNGGIVWVDLRGAAAPLLRADREGLRRTQPDTWSLEGLFKRWLNSWKPHVPHWLPIWLPPTRIPTVQRTNTFPHRLGQGDCTPETISAMWLAEEGLYRSYRNWLFWEQRQSLMRDGAFNMCISLGTTLRKKPADSDHFDLHFGRCQDLDVALDLAITIVTSPWDDKPTLAKELSNDLGMEFRGIPGLFPAPTVSLSTASRHSATQPWVGTVKGHLASEGLWPDLSRSLALLNCRGLTGQLDQYELLGPNRIQQMSSFDPSPSWLNDFDLCSPFTAFPLRSVRSKWHEWCGHRVWRALYMLPFLFGRQSKNWLPIFEARMPFPQLMLFMPNPDHYEWLFAEHTQEEWNQGSASALWDLKTGAVLYADGIHTEASLRAEGKPLREWLGIR